MTAEEALRQLLETSERIAIYKMADGTLSVPGKAFRQAQNNARQVLGIPLREIKDKETGGLLAHSGTSESDLT